MPALVGDVTYSQFLDWKKPVETFVQNDVAAYEKGKEGKAGGEAGDGQEVGPEEVGEPTYLLNVWLYFMELVGNNAHVERPEILEVLVRSLSALVDADLKDIPIHQDGDDLKDLLENGVDWYDGKDVTLCRLSCHLCAFFRNYIATHEPPDVAHCVEYKGERYYIEPERAMLLADASGGIPDVKKYTVAEVEDLNELQRMFDYQIKQVGDPDGALQFQLDLCMLAVLLRKEGERLPEKKVRSEWIDARSRHFAELPMSVVYDVRAFFLSTLKRYLEALFLRRTSGKGQSSPQAPGPTGNRQGRRNAGPRRSGGLSIVR